ncbi:uridine kinase family protein [Kineococcus sp. SYSU DK001]|uniref:uridine kinase family protein n=1 Tax=Kineococcus sp. SYSU DK001 TaxID=3383122 RepID=UPI003D7C72C3
MHLLEGEPAAGPWRPASVGDVLDALGTGVVAVDGRSASGKSTLAGLLHAEARRRGLTSVVVHTDDLAWHHSFFDWADLLVEGVLAPLRRGVGVACTPPGWAPHGRSGSVDVPAGTDLVLVEGVGAGRREASAFLDALVWVQSDHALARVRGLERDVASGVNGDRAAAEAFWDEWERAEQPFLAGQRPWERARLVVAGTPVIDLAPGQLAVSPGPGASSAPGRPGRTASPGPAAGPPTRRA